MRFVILENISAVVKQELHTTHMPARQGLQSESIPTPVLYDVLEESVDALPCSPQFEQYEEARSQNSHDSYAVDDPKLHESCVDFDSLQCLKR